MSDLFPFNNYKFDNFYDRMDNLVRGSLHSARNFLMDNFRLDIRDEEDKYVIEAELPGVEKDDIKVTMDNGNLTISVEMDEEKEETGKQYVHRERRYRTMRRQIHLRDALEDGTSARMEDGILYVTVAKEPKEEDTGTTIEIH